MVLIMSANRSQLVLFLFKLVFLIYKFDTLSPNCRRVLLDVFLAAVRRVVFPLTSDVTEIQFGSIRRICWKEIRTSLAFTQFPLSSPIHGLSIAPSLLLSLFGLGIFSIQNKDRFSMVSGSTSPPEMAVGQWVKLVQQYLMGHGSNFWTAGAVMRRMTFLAHVH